MANTETLKKAWVSAVLVYAVIRTAVIWKIFAKYGVNPYIYLTVDVIAAYFYAIYSTKLVIEVIQTHYRALIKYLLLTIFFNFVPDIYILLAADNVPSVLIKSFINVILVLAVIAGIGIYREIRKRRKQK